MSEKMRPMTIASSSAATRTNGASEAKSLPERIAAKCLPPWVLSVIFMSMLGLLLAITRPGTEHATMDNNNVKDEEDPDMSGHRPGGSNGGMDMDHHTKNKGGKKGTSTTPIPDSSTLQSEQALLDYYQGNDLSGAFAIGDEHGFKHLARKMYQKRKAKQSFVLGAIGSGNLVGAFGNCEKDGYLSLVARTVQGAFKAQGLTFEIRKVVFGSFCGVAPKSATSCVNDLLGSDVDLFHYSFPHSEDNADARLRLGAIAKGTVHIIEPDCAGDAGSRTKGKNAKLLSKYAMLGSDVLCLEDALQSIMGEAYQGQSWGLTGDGMHTSARDSPSGLVWRNWLPGPLGHQFLADATSMLLLRALRMMTSMTVESGAMSVHEFPPSPVCHMVHSPHHGQNGIANKLGKWRELPGESAADDDVPSDDRAKPECEHPDECGYYEARGSSAGRMEFDIPAQENLPNRKVYVCCCCNAELCVSEQFRDYVDFTWSTPATEVSRVEAVGDRASSIAGQECLLLAKDMPFANKLMVSIKTATVNVPVRISAVIAG